MQNLLLKKQGGADMFSDRTLTEKGVPPRSCSASNPKRQRETEREREREKRTSVEKQMTSSKQNKKVASPLEKSCLVEKKNCLKFTGLSGFT